MPGTKEVSFHCKVESSCPHERSINGDRDLYQALHPSLNWTWCLMFFIFLDKWSFTVLSKARTALESCLRSCDTYDTLGYSFPTSFFLTLVIADNWVGCCLFVLPMGRLYFVLIKSSVIFSKILYHDNSIIRNVFLYVTELLVLPGCCKQMHWNEQYLY
jgi:hypothetical protein